MTQPMSRILFISRFLFFSGLLLIKFFSAQQCVLSQYIIPFVHKYTDSYFEVVVGAGSWNRR
jgi:hypothetical protein